MTELEKLLSEAQTLLQHQDTPPASQEALVTSSASEAGYVTQYGDTVASIAEAHGLTVEQLMALNDLIDPESLIIGVTLRTA